MTKIELAAQEASHEEVGSAGQPELDDSAEALQAQSTAHKMPVGIAALFGGLIAFGVYYFFAYVGWDQTSELKAGTALSTNITHTVAYTAIPAAVIVLMAVAMARRKGKRR
jgi:TRAP-type C4-dicarboxylate transport system permease small subunit